MKKKKYLVIDDYMLDKVLNKIKEIITRLIVIDIAPLTVLFCNCPLADL